MEVKNMKDFTGGWFVGDFQPTLHQTSNVEVAIKEYKAETAEKAHYHKVATEYTVVTEGFARFTVNFAQENEYEKILLPGQIAVIMPGEIVKFHALTDVKTVVVKIPSVKNDKFETE